MEKQNTIALFDYDSLLCSKQLNNEPFCKQNNSGAVKSPFKAFIFRAVQHEFALSLALASQIQRRVSVMRELGNGLF